MLGTQKCNALETTSKPFGVFKHSEHPLFPEPLILGNKQKPDWIQRLSFQFFCEFLHLPSSLASKILLNSLLI